MSTTQTFTAYLEVTVNAGNENAARALLAQLTALLETQPNVVSAFQTLLAPSSKMANN